MRKVSRPYKRAGKSGWWLRWQENGKRIMKTFPTKSLAEHFRHIKYQQLNSDVFISAIDIPWKSLKEEFLQRFAVRGLRAASKYEAERMLSKFYDCCHPHSSKSITQRMVNIYLLERQKPDEVGNILSPYTINKDIERLKTFIRWMIENKYHVGGINLVKLKTPKILIKALNTEQIGGLFKACPTKAWRCRLLLSLVTGLRKYDIDNLLVADLDLKRASIDSKSQKTSKAYIGRPLPNAVCPELADYLKSLPEGQVKLFGDRNIRKTWEIIRGETKITRQDLRRTFSTLMQKIGSIGSAQNLLEHYDSRTTIEFYTDQELILRWKVNQLPVKEWLR